MIDATLRHSIMYKLLETERLKNEVAVTSKIQAHKCRLCITPYFEKQKLTVLTRIGSLSNNILHFVHSVSNLINVAFLCPKYFTATTYHTYRLCHSIILYEQMPPMPMQRPLYACYAGGIT